MDMLREQGITWCLPLIQSVFAEAKAEVGEVDSAIAVLADALILGERTGQKWIEAELYRVRGDTLLKSAPSNLPAPEVALSRAIEIARDQQTRTFELRAAASLARLWRDQGKRDAARDLLAPVYAGFTEGFDTVDLKEAKSLLDELPS
jgi:predicted ATPase